VLSRLETNQETLILPSYTFSGDPKSPKQTKQKKQLNYDNYKRVVFALHNVSFETAKNQGADVNLYFNFTVNTAILDHHLTEFNSSDKHHAGTVFISQSDPTIFSEYPIIIIRSGADDGTSLQPSGIASQ
jgi:hypothetical protein